jgi:beta-glucanase (GH16 family)
MAVENQPHSVDDFNGVIEEGYGKGLTNFNLTLDAEDATLRTGGVVGH